MPRPGPSTIKYGGNTSCVEVRCGGRQVIFDAGTGIYPLGEKTDIIHMDIFLSHTHIDHIQGLPLFKPLYNRNANVALWAGHLMPERTVQQVVSHLMQSPVFPMTILDVASQVEFNDFVSGETIQNNGLNSNGITIETCSLPHPDRATGYRLTFEGKSVCYITDIEHEPGQLDKKLIEFIDGCDLFIYDSTYDDEGFNQYIGWGHSTWQQAVRLADAAEVKQLALFHHDPGLNDDALDERAEKLAEKRKAAFVSKEGDVVKL